MEDLQFEFDPYAHQNYINTVSNLEYNPNNNDIIKDTFGTNAGIVDLSPDFDGFQAVLYMRSSNPDYYSIDGWKNLQLQAGIEKQKVFKYHSNIWRIIPYNKNDYAQSARIIFTASKESAKNLNDLINYINNEIINNPKIHSLVGLNNKFNRLHWNQNKRFSKQFKYTITGIPLAISRVDITNIDNLKATNKILSNGQYGDIQLDKIKWKRNLGLQSNKI